MRLHNDEECRYDLGGRLGPWLFYTNATPSADVPYTDAPLLSLCWDVSAAVLYVKTANNKAAADWTSLIVASGGTVSGNLTVTGTITAGDLVAST